MDGADVRRLRIADGADADDRTRDRPDAAVGAPSMAAQTLSLGSYPTGAASYYAVEPVSVLGAEVEGGAGTLNVASGHFFALNLGTKVPPAGTRVVVTFVGVRWVFRYDG